MTLARTVFAALTLACSLAVAAAPERDTRPDTWTATDALGRRLDPSQYRTARPDRTIGVFYFLWIESKPGDRVLDLTRLRAENPNDPAYGPKGAFHWWGQPYLGYYRSDDAWVIARHAQMLADAGVDVVVFDVTNGYTYDATLLKLLDVYADLRKQGRRTPQIAFLAHNRAGPTVKHLMDVVYSKRLHEDLWFRWKGRPLLMAPLAQLDADATAFFSVRDSWAWTNPTGWFKDGKLKWPWLDDSPQHYGWDASPDRAEEISVSVAQHPTRPLGRSYHDGQQPPEADVKPEQGRYFAEQWKRALDVDPPFVFVTGWNEWIAQRFVATDKGPKHCGYLNLKAGDTFFVDTWSEEFSRDIEPMAGGHGDDYYYQLADAVRRYKGVRQGPVAVGPTPIDPAGGFDQWNAVTPEYLDDVGETAPRDAAGYGDAGQYRNESGRNDIESAKVAYDKEFVWFYAKAAAPLTPPSADGWMTLLVRTGQPGPDWAGFDLAVNRTAPFRNGAYLTTSVEARTRQGWLAVGMARVRFDGREIMLGIPRELLGPAGRGPRFEFKWTDNLPVGGDPMALIDQGDTAPNGRFAYAFRVGP